MEDGVSKGLNLCGFLEGAGLHQKHRNPMVFTTHACFVCYLIRRPFVYGS